MSQKAFEVWKTIPMISVQSIEDLRQFLVHRNLDIPILLDPDKGTDASLEIAIEHQKNEPKHEAIRIVRLTPKDIGIKKKRNINIGDVNSAIKKLPLEQCPVLTAFFLWPEYLEQPLDETVFVWSEWLFTNRGDDIIFNLYRNTRHQTVGVEWNDPDPDNGQFVLDPTDVLIFKLP